LRARRWAVGGSDLVEVIVGLNVASKGPYP
jgi:hypothetical protein